MKPDVHVSQLRKYRMGLTGATDLLDLRAMDTAEDVIVRFIDHDMHYPQGKGSKNSRKLLPRSEWRFEAASEFEQRWQHQVDALARGEQDGCTRRVCSPV
jgi:hypothetical protein